MLRSLASLLLLPLVACAEAGRADTILALTGDADAGAAVYETNCAGCHGTDATGGSAPGILGEESEEVVEVVLYGEDDMPAFAETLEDQAIADVVAWLDAQG
jgi:mono/diheme cytochrome c family protein